MLAAVLPWSDLIQFAMFFPCKGVKAQERCLWIINQGREPSERRRSSWKVLLINLLWCLIANIYPCRDAERVSLILVDCYIGPGLRFCKMDAQLVQHVFWLGFWFSLFVVYSLRWGFCLNVRVSFCWELLFTVMLIFCLVYLFRWKSLGTIFHVWKYHLLKK